MNLEIINIVSTKVEIKEEYVKVVLSLFEEGCTIPFIARYRKEKTNNLDEDQIRNIQKVYETEDKLFNRKHEVIKSIEEKGKLTEELRTAILNATVIKEVETLYLPFKEKKKTRASIAIAKGLEPLADWLLKFVNYPVEKEASKYIVEDKVATVEEAIQGAKDIIAERISDDARVRECLTRNMTNYGKITTSLKKDAVDEKKIYELYYNHTELVKYIPNHRVLAIDRGENLDLLKVDISVDEERTLTTIYKIIRSFYFDNEASKVVKEAIDDGFKRLLYPSIEREVRNALTTRAQEQAIDVFAINLEQLLMMPPLKNRRILGVDPAFRTGCKLAVLSECGDFICKDVIYPNEKYKGEQHIDKRIKEAKEKVAAIVKEYKIDLIAIGNGTASRETEEFIANVIKEYKLNVDYVITSEAGASVYSASELAKKEYPDLAVEERSAISIGRRVLEPLAELIKIDPKSIGVGQYQHDVNQKKLDESLNYTVQKVVNNVGVNINSATVELLSYVSGLTKKTAENIVEYRKENGKISTREEVKKIKGIGPKSYEQAIGFLKILDSKNPLDKTFIHPDNYSKILTLLKDKGLDVNELGKESFNEKINLLTEEDFAKYDIGVYSYLDIKEELTRPLRDIRDDYPTPTLRRDVLHIEDLVIGMKLQGTVRSVVDFGAFVDIGLKNAGLIHKSKFTKSSITHPLEIVNVGDIVDVYVVEVNLETGRVGLSLFND